MNADDPAMSALAEEIARAECQLQELEWEIGEIGQPAAHELQRRLDALKIEHAALQRNLSELLGVGADGGRDEAVRLHKIEALLDHILREEDSLQHDADFLHQSGRTSPELAARAGKKLVELILHGIRRVVGDHHPLGMSVFVNHDHRNLVDRYGLKKDNGASASS